MCKRYYVEVTGLGPDGEQQLREAGVAPESILVKGDDAHRPSVALAIEQVTGKTIDDMRCTDRSRLTVAARTMYAHFAHIAGDSAELLATDLKAQEKRIRRYIQDYDDKMVGDREFILQVRQVEAILQSNPEWKEPEKVIQRPSAIHKTPSRKRRKKRRKKTNLKNAKRLVRSVSTDKASSRQLEIQW